MSRHNSIAVLTAVLVVAGSTAVWAQGRGGFGGGGGGTGMMGSGMSAFGSSGMGGSGFGGGGMGMGGMGGSAFGGGMGTGGMGGSGFGGGMSGFGGNSAFGGQSGFGGGQGGGQSFVGRDGADMAAVFNQMGRAGTQFFNQMNRNNRGGGGGRNRDQGNNSEENAESAVRVQLNIAFPHQRPAPTVVANNVRTRLERLLPPQGVAQPEVVLEGDTVVLRGMAANESQRLVIEKLIAMEPGVMNVRNELIVAAPPADENQPATDR